jgi:hypothetical protein
MRYLTADKPFWHDYIASLKQWNMHRWSDGDDFLVAYVGPPAGIGERIYPDPERPARPR